VCIKQVPDTTDIRLDPKTNTMIREGVASIINPDDKSAIEAALQLKELNGARITAVCMGPPQASKALREALAMGCDDALLISGREFSGSDTYATAYTLGAGIRTIGFDLVLTGRQAIDGDTAQVGPQLAEQLQIPQVSYAEEIALGEDDSLIVKRKTDDGRQLVRVRQPCLITVPSESVAPRYMTVQGTVDAFTKDIRVMSFDDLKELINPDWIGLNGSPTKVVKTHVKSGKGSGEKITNLTSDEAVTKILEKLREIHLI